MPNLLNTVNGYVTSVSTVMDAVQLTLPVSSVSGLGTVTAGQVVISRGTSKEERVNFTSVSSLNLIVPVAGRGVGNPASTAQTHAAGDTIELVIAEVYQNGIITFAKVDHNDNGTHKLSNLVAEGVVDLNSAQSLTNKVLTSPVINTGILNTPTMRNWDAWEDANEAWTYLSATTITVPTNATTKYQTGDKIKLTQSATVKYFYIVGVTATVLTITGGSDYTFTNVAISANYYSKSQNPQGFPDWFNYTLTTSVPTGTYTGVTVYGARFNIKARTVSCQFGFLGTLGGTIPNVIYHSLPVNALNLSDPQNFSGVANDSEILLCDVANADLTKGRIVRAGGFPLFTAGTWGARYGGFCSYNI